MSGQTKTPVERVREGLVAGRRDSRLLPGWWNNCDAALSEIENALKKIGYGEPPLDVFDNPVDALEWGGKIARQTLRESGADGVRPRSQKRAGSCGLDPDAAGRGSDVDARGDRDRDSQASRNDRGGGVRESGAGSAEGSGIDSAAVAVPETASCFFHGDFDPRYRRCPVCWPTYASDRKRGNR